MQNRRGVSAPFYFGLTAVAGLAVLSSAFLVSHAAAPVNAADLHEGGSDQTRIVAAVKRDKPSVVALEVTVDGTQYVPVDPFGNTAPQATVGRASGSGFVYDHNGTIVTNAHVISPPRGGQVEKIDVIFANGDRVPGHVTAVDRGADLALVKVDNYGKLPAPLQLGDSKNIEAGQWAIAIGEPLELRQTVTVGVVSGFDRSEPIGDEEGRRHVFSGLLQTSAPINPGNSGGPLIDMEGRVIGINQSVAGGAQGIGFAIPVDSIRADVAAMLSGKSTSDSGGAAANAAFIGIGLAPLASVRAELHDDGPSGVAVQAVTSGSPADVAGIEPGDVIESIDGKAVDSPDAAAAAIHAHRPGETVNVRIRRSGSEQSVAVQTTTAPQVGMQQQPEPQAPDRSAPDDPSEGSQQNSSDDPSSGA